MQGWGLRQPGAGDLGRRREVRVPWEKNVESTRFSTERLFFFLNNTGQQDEVWPAWGLRVQGTGFRVTQTPFKSQLFHSTDHPTSPQLPRPKSGANNCTGLRAVVTNKWYHGNKAFVPSIYHRQGLGHYCHLGNSLVVQ